MWDIWNNANQDDKGKCQIKIAPVFCSVGWHNDLLSPLISGQLGPRWAAGNRASRLAEALYSIMNGVKAKSTRLRVKPKGTVPGSAKLQGTSVRALQWTLRWSAFILWLNKCFWGCKTTWCECMQLWIVHTCTNISVFKSKLKFNLGIFVTEVTVFIYLKYLSHKKKWPSHFLFNGYSNSLPNHFLEIKDSDVGCGHGLFVKLNFSEELFVQFDLTVI